MMKECQAIIAVMILACSPVVAATPYSGGDGSAADPFVIAEAADFLDLSATSTDWDKHFRLTADIDLAATPFTQAPIAPDESPAAGFQGTPFTGVFDGGGHAIANLTIAAPESDYIGLFGSIGDSGRVIKLGLQDATIAGKSYVAALAGQHHGTIEYCYADGSVVGSSGFVGGLAGGSWGAVRYSYARVSVSGGSNVGGLVGHGSVVVCCYAAGPVSGNVLVGGLVGSQTLGRIRDSIWDIEASGRQTSAGGTGKTTAEMKTACTYTDVGWLFVEDGVTGGDWIVPQDEYPTLTHRVYPQAVIPDLKGLSEQDARSALAAAGFAAGQTYWVYDTSVSQGLLSATYPAAGAAAYVGLTRPHLLLAKDTKYAGGNGGFAEPYEIADLGNWVDMMNTQSDWGRSFRLTGDIDLDGHVFDRAVIAPNNRNDLTFQGTAFSGVFEGGGHRISNVTIKAAGYYVGLFGYVYTGHIRNLGLDNVRIQGGYEYVGGLTGHQTLTTISNCYSTGTVHGSAAVGGLVGYATGTYNTVLTENCYSSVRVSGIASVGGLMGYRVAGINRNCYSVGRVSATGDYAGGLIGYAHYGTAMQCFWDMETSGRESSGCGTGKTTAQMRTLSTFTDAGWDFNDEGVNGTANIWRMCADGTAYPRLNWESLPGDTVCPDGIGVADLQALAEMWLADFCTPANNYCGGADLDYSGAVDMADLAILATNWLNE